MALVDERLARSGNVAKPSEILVTELPFGLTMFVYQSDVLRCKLWRSLMLVANVVV